MDVAGLSTLYWMLRGFMTPLPFPMSCPRIMRCCDTTSKGTMMDCDMTLAAMPASPARSLLSNTTSSRSNTSRTDSYVPEHKKMFRFKFQQNSIINEEFEFFEGGEGGGGGVRVLLTTNLLSNTTSSRSNTSRTDSYVPGGITLI